MAVTWRFHFIQHNYAPVPPTYQGQSDKGVVERPCKLPLGASFVRLLLLYENLNHLVVVLVHLVFHLEVLSQLDQALLHLLIIWSLQGIKDGCPHQEVGEGDDYQGESSNLEQQYYVIFQSDSCCQKYSRSSSSSSQWSGESDYDLCWSNMTVSLLVGCCQRRGERRGERTNQYFANTLSVTVPVLNVRRTGNNYPTAAS